MTWMRRFHNNSPFWAQHRGECNVTVVQEIGINYANERNPNESDPDSKAKVDYIVERYLDI